MEFIIALVVILLCSIVVVTYTYTSYKRLAKFVQEQFAREHMYTEYMITKIKKEMGEDNGA